jgi:hypothetical protein
MRYSVISRMNRSALYVLHAAPVTRRRKPEKEGTFAEDGTDEEGPLSRTVSTSIAALIADCYTLERLGIEILDHIRPIDYFMALAGLMEVWALLLQASQFRRCERQ